MSDKQQQFIESIAPKAQEIQQKYGVPASIAIAQAALESGWGTSAKGNNLFGIKAGSCWNGATIDMATHEYINGVSVGINDRFRSYASTENSMENYGHFLSSNGRYSDVTGACNAYDAADALQRAGYATDPRYASKLKEIINTYDLTRFDDASYRGYTNGDDSFAKTRARLHQQRMSDPASWEDFKQSFVQLFFSMFVDIFAGLFNTNPQTADNSAHDHTTIKRPEVPHAANAPARMTERA